MKFFGTDGVFGPSSEELQKLFSKFVAESPEFKGQVEKAFAQAVQKFEKVATHQNAAVSQQLEKQNSAFEARIHSDELKSLVSKIADQHIENLEKGNLFEQHRDQLNKELDAAFSTRIEQVKSEISDLLAALESKQVAATADLKANLDRHAREFQYSFSKNFLLRTKKLKDRSEQYAKDAALELERRLATNRTLVLAEINRAQEDIREEIANLQAEVLGTLNHSVRQLMTDVVSETLIPILREDTERFIAGILSNQVPTQFISNRNMARLQGVSVRRVKRNRQRRLGSNL